MPPTMNSHISLKSDALLANRSLNSMLKSSQRDDPYRDDIFALMQHLQTTLSIEKIFKFFMGSINHSIRIDGISYHPIHNNGDVFVGSRQHKAHTYALNIAEKQLGELRIYRQNKLSWKEARRLKQMVKCLLFPLRNAIEYQIALERSLQDTLTKIANRRAFDQSLKREIKRARRSGESLALLVFDIDHFKDINDRFGHVVGDNGLKSVAATAAKSIRSSDVLFRYAGDEFVVLLHNTELESAASVADRLRQDVALKLHVCGSHTLRINVSVGVATLAEFDGNNDLFLNADQELYRAKQSGGNAIAYPMR